jgi:hypothetical protein
VLTNDSVYRFAFVSNGWVCRDFWFARDGPANLRPRVNVVVIAWHAVMADINYLRKVKWDCLVCNFLQLRRDVTVIVW